MSDGLSSPAPFLGKIKTAGLCGAVLIEITTKSYETKVDETMKGFF